MTNNIILSPDQDTSCEGLIDWYVNRRSAYITFAGYAGTGKTTTLAELRKRLHKMFPNLRVAFCAFTGKAAWVLKHKLRWGGAVFGFQDTCSTIHKLIYVPIIDEKTGEVLGWKKCELIMADLIIIDEASMVSFEIWRDLLGYNIPIIAVGDHGQLPPIGSDFNLMENPAIRLEKIHRQAEGNPIIHVSRIVREEGRLREFKEWGDYGKGGVIRVDQRDSATELLVEEQFENFNNHTMILAGTNKVRVNLNKYVRQLKGYDSASPVLGDRVICLQNNARAQNIPIFNGMCGNIEQIEDRGRDYFKMMIKMDGEKQRYIGIVSKHFFNNEYGQVPPNLHLSEVGDRFDYGNCLTVHKAQGSEADNVVLFERSRWKSETEDLYVRWLYTGVTRAIENLLIVK